MVDSEDGSFTFIASDTGVIATWTAQCEQATGIDSCDVIGTPLGELFFAAADAAPLPVGALGRHSVRALFQVFPYPALPLALSASTHQLGNDMVLVIDARAAPATEQQDEAFAAIVERLPCIFYVIDAAGRLQYWNARLAAAVQRPASALFGVPVVDFFDPPEQPGISAKFRAALEHGEASHEATLVGLHGARTPYLFECARIDLGGQIRVVGTGVDISERVQAIQSLRICQRAMHAAVNAICITRCEGGQNIIDYVNPAFERLTGYSAAESVGQDPRFMRAGTLDNDERQRIHQAVHAGASVHSVLRNQRKNGEIFWNDLRIDPVFGERGELTHLVAIINDVTESKHYEERLRHLATHDSLTGLANRAMLHDRLDIAIGRARRSGNALALAYVDLDNFKYVNDTFGHSGGDAVLREISNRLGNAVREGDTVARVGGDEFVVVINDCNGDHVAEFVDRMRLQLVAPMQMGPAELHPTVSIGVSIFPHDADTCPALLRAADAAMYAAKTAGKNRYQFYSSEIDQAVHRYLDMEAQLRRGIAGGELTLRYQPKVDLASGRMVGAEALVRWNHPSKGWMTPDAFISFAEECGLIVQLGEWVLRESCATLRQIREAGYPDFSLSVNLSARQLNQNNFAETVAAILDDMPCNCGTLELEVTESLLMHNPDEAARTLTELKALGLLLSIDDFGTGYSSLSYLQKFPLDFIKIDRSFLAGVVDSPDNAIITQAIIALGHNLNMRVIAEGVETAGQIEFLQRNHCDQMQGFYFSPAVAKSTLMDFLSSNRMLDCFAENGISA